MNIPSNYSYNDYNVSMQGKDVHTNKAAENAWRKFSNRVKQKIIDIIPEATFKDEKKRVDKYEKIDGWLSRPDSNRFIMGVTAITTQPFIDYYNHRVDEETRTVSRNRTIAKIIAGTSIGILVRGGCYKLVTKMTNPNGTKKLSKALLPNDWIEKFSKNQKLLSNYKSAISTAIALGIMIFTNFLIDAPLTLILTNKFNEKSAKNLKAKEAKNLKAKEAKNV